MKKKTMLLLTIALLAFCSIGVYAECNHDWDDWDYENYNADNHKHVYYCWDCGEKKYVLEPHNWEQQPYEEEKYNSTYHKALYACKDCYETKYALEKHNLSSYVDYEYGNNNICYAVYTCTDCYEKIKKPVKHKWKYSTYSSYSTIDDKYHYKTTSAYCTQCFHDRDFSTKEKHNLGFHKSYDKSFTYYGCDKCQYIYGDKTISNKITNKSLKKKKNYTFKIPILYKDGIKSIKKTVGKNIFTVKKKAKNKFIVKGKKKGKAKVRVTTKSGVVYTYIIKFKQPLHTIKAKVHFAPPKTALNSPEDTLYLDAIKTVF